jgi:hypothetical protein
MQAFSKRRCALLFVFATLACERHVQLKFPDSTPGEEFTCFTTDGQEKCQPTTTIDPAKSNQAGTTFVILPRACKRQFNEITIHDSGSSHPTVQVRCAPLENTIR